MKTLLSNIHFNGHKPPKNSNVTTTLCSIQYHMKVLLNMFRLNGLTLGYYPQTYNLQPLYTVTKACITWKYCLTAFIWMVAYCTSYILCFCLLANYSLLARSREIFFWISSLRIYATKGYLKENKRTLKCLQFWIMIYGFIRGLKSKNHLVQRNKQCAQLLSFEWSHSRVLSANLKGRTTFTA